MLCVSCLNSFYVNRQGAEGQKQLSVICTDMLQEQRGVYGEMNLLVVRGMLWGMPDV